MRCRKFGIDEITYFSNCYKTELLPSFGKIIGKLAKLKGPFLLSVRFSPDIII